MLQIFLFDVEDATKSRTKTTGAVSDHKWDLEGVRFCSSGRQKARVEIY